ncbi:triple tyrosine motif-containing protein [Wenyingzhuangia sp. IMCC45574]
MSQLFAQELPPISIYSSKEYGAENQNWSISQGEDGHIYVANNKGLLEFDGANWSLYPSPNETIVRSVKAKGNKVYTGFFNGFGYWQKNRKGILEYTSLSAELDLLDDEQFWGIETVEEWVVFQSLQRIYFCNIENGAVKIHQTEGQLQNVFEVDDVLYYQELGKGVYKMLKGEPELIVDNPVLKKNVVVGVHAVNGELIYITDSKGAFVEREKGLEVWNVTIQEELSSKYTIYSSIQLKNDNIVLGTISHGLIVLDDTGNVVYKINQKKGLSNNTVLSLFEDSEQSVWLGLDDGINVLDVDSPLRVFKDINGVIGTVYSSIVHKDRVYLGTNQGLFSKNKDENEPFLLVKGTEGQVWTLKELNGELFCGHNSGTFLIKGNTATRFSAVMGAWKIEAIDENTFIQGTYTGLYVFRKNEGMWELKNKLKGFNISSRYFEIFENKTIFINHEYKGVYKLSVNKELTEVLNTKIISSIPKGLHSALVKYKGDVLYAYKKGVFKYVKQEDKFIKDETLSAYLSGEKYISGVLYHAEKSEDKLWGFTQKEVVCVEQGGVSSKPNIKTYAVPLVLRKGATGFENISEVSSKKYLLGNSYGYITLDIKTLSEVKGRNVEINQIKNASLDKNYVNIALDSVRKFSNEANNFEFYCSAPVFDQFKQVEFQYQVEGLSNLWSEWSTESKIVVENLPFGKYVFSVKARVDGIETENIASYRFSVKRPWYFSNLWIGLYLLGIFFFSVFMHRVYTLKHNKDKQRLLREKQKELELQKLENDKRLTLMENEKLEADVALKSKELASSTMSVIKKNELLSAIKDELLKGDQKSMNNVIRIIDKNLNNEGDWELFEEAFNNADKDFIKKVKQLHPSLTSNDLRLCAYLRLNLSSKEIAPLLNISPKSVEVKRYRLRKKMSLANEQNLVDYILQM